MNRVECGRIAITGVMSQYRLEHNCEVQWQATSIQREYRLTMPYAENRSPNPPIGYACDCTLPPAHQIDLVAEFYVNRIRPSRIAYRLGIDLAQVEAWLSGEQDSDRFQELIRRHRRRKYQIQLRRAERFCGQQSYEMRLAAERELAQKQSQ